MNIINKTRCLLYGGVLALLAAFSATIANAANPAGDLRIEPLAAYNLVVDSNVESPSSYGPRSAYLAAKFWNDGTNDLTGVYAYIGDYKGGVNDTPGVYPTNKTAALTGPLTNGMFALTHEGGSLGVLDATRYIGTIPAGDYVAVYWLVSYPLLDESGNAVWGPSVKPADDLWLNYDVWGTAVDGGSPLNADITRTVTMRNEISAMANKILPNSANKVPQEYQDLLNKYAPVWTNAAEDGTPGTLITSEGVWYDLGNVGAGFDNNGDLVPDRNAWLQPVGDPSTFDSSSFRLVETHALVVVKLNDGTELVYDVDDQLYFENIPENNRGAVGFVKYDFLTMASGASCSLSPYQEVASGNDNEKFNGDYGASLGGGALSAGTSLLEMNKTASLSQAGPGSNITYSISFTNAGTAPVGQPQVSMPLVVQDLVPTGTLYVAGSATNNNVLPTGVTNYSVFYSTNLGSTWTSTEPAASNVNAIQWWLSDVMATATYGVVRFNVTVRTPYLPASPLIVNTGGLSMGNSEAFLEDGAQTLVAGTNTIGDMVYLDNGNGGGGFGNAIKDGTEVGISNITINLYADVNTNGALEASDVYLASTSTALNGFYAFTNLTDGGYIVEIDTDDADLPSGYTSTTSTMFSAILSVSQSSYTNADFGFAPALSMTKTRTTGITTRDGSNVTFQITVTNRFAGAGGALTTYEVWATGLNSNTFYTSAGTAWDALTKTNAYLPVYPDTNFALCTPGGAADTIGLQGHSIAAQSGTITKVELLIPVNVSGTWSDDTVAFYFFTNANGSTPAVYSTTNMSISSLPAGTNFFAIDVTTALTSWTWSRFAAGSSNVIQVSCAKLTGPDGGVFGVDQAGFRITSDLVEDSGSLERILDPVPLVDSYNISNLQFVSATRTPSSVTTNGTTGTVYWANVGPVYPGGTSIVSVTFKALDPLGGALSNGVTNVAYISNGTYGDGSPANSATSEASVVVLRAGSIGDVVWWDMNGNAIQDPGEEGIGGVSVVMTSTNAPFRTNVTDSSGYYRFESLPSNGVYSIVVRTNTVGTSITNTFDGDGTANSSNNVTLTNLDDTNTVDFGYRFIGFSNVIQGTLWNDVNRNASTNRDTGEPFLTNVLVFLYSNGTASGAAFTSNATTSNGVFRFVGNYSGNYSIRVVTNSGSMTNRSWTGSYDSDGLTTTNYVSLSITPGQVLLGNFSYYETGAFTIGDQLFVDWNGNALQDSNEVGLANVDVSLYVDSDGSASLNTSIDSLVGTTTSATNGVYLFQNRIATNYLILVDAGDTNLPSSYSVTADPYVTPDGFSYVQITNASKTNQDFGFLPFGNGSMGNQVWKDVDGNGVKSGASEVGISNVTVRLWADVNGYGAYALVTSTVTDVNGQYVFEHLPDGPFRVTVGTNDTALPSDAFGSRYVPTTATTQSMTITNGASYAGADFGFASLAAIGDTIFWDANENGTQDWTEQGVSNVTVQLYIDVDGNTNYSAGTDTFYAAQVTIADGTYLFTALPTGRYVVVVVETGRLGSATISADPDADGLPANDPEAVGCDGEYGLRLTAGQNFMGADFGYLPPGVLGDTLWVDTNTNGVRDTSESGIGYISVQLISNVTVVASNETDGDGYYYFTELADGTYRVAVSTNDADFSTMLGQVYDPDGTLDNQASSVVISNGTVVSIGGAARTNADLSVDFGYRYAGSNTLSGTIGLDAIPYDGVLGSGPSGVAGMEVPYSGVSVYIYLWNDNSNGVVNSGETLLLSSTTTATNGDYAFSFLANGDGDDHYIVSIAAPEDFLRLTTTNGLTPSTNVVETLNAQSNAVSAYQSVPVVVSRTGMDFAFRSTRSYDYGDLPNSYGTSLPSGARHVIATLTNMFLGATVDAEVNGVASLDASNDGADEDGVSTIGAWQNGTNGGWVAAQIGKGSGWLVGFVDFNGNSNFADAGELVISRAVVTNGGNGSGLYTNYFPISSNVVSATNVTRLYARFRMLEEEPTFPSFAYAGSADDGEVEDYQFVFGALNDIVWNDMDGDGVRDAFEPPIANVRVYIDLNTNGLYSTNEPYGLSSALGLYGIGGLSTGSYVLSVDTSTLPVGAVQTYDLNGTNTPNTTTFSITNGQVRTDCDFGYRGNITLGDYVWNDANTNGIQTVGETGMVGVAVRLYDTSTNQLAIVTSAGDGSFAFTNLLPGTYFLGFTEPGGFSLSPMDQGGDDTLDSDASPTTGYTVPFALAAGATNLDWEAGFYSGGAAASLGDYVWRDSNLDGLQDAGEPGVSNVTVQLFDLASNTLATVVTDTNGMYTFAGLSVGTYFVGVIAPTGYVFTVPTNGAVTNDSDVLGTNGHTAAIVLGNGSNVVTVDAGLFDAVPGVRLVLTAGGVADGMVLVTNTGSDVGYTYQVINTGNTYLASLTVTDSVWGVIGSIPGPMAPGSTNTLLLVASNVTVDVNNLGVVVATPAYSNGTAVLGLGTVTNTDNAVLDIVSPSFSIIKTQVNPTNRPAAVGEPVVFEIVITNTGDVAFGTVPVTDAFDNVYVSYVSSVPAANVTNASDLRWTNVGPLPIGAGSVITAQFTAVSSGTWTNRVVSAPSATNGVPVPVSTGSVPAQVVQPAITVIKTQLSPTNGPVEVGQPVVFVMVITNTGDVSLGTVPVTDAFESAYVSFTTSSPAANVTNASNVIWTNVGPLAAGAGTVITAQFMAVSSGSWTNLAVSAPTTTNGVPVPVNTGSVPAQVAQSAVTVIKTLVSPTNRPAAVGEPVVFAIVITNTGNVGLGTVPVTDAFNSAYVSYSTSAPAANITNANNLIWTNVGPLAIGAGTVITAQFNAASSGAWTNLVLSAATSTNGNPVPVSTGSAPAQVVQPALTIIKTQVSPTNGPANVGDTVVFQIVLTNNGDVALGSVPVTDSFDSAYVSYTSSVPAANITNANHVIWTNLGPLSAGAGTVITAQFTAVSSGSWTNRAVSAPTTTNGVPVPVSTGSVPSQVVQPGLSIVKTQITPTNRPAAVGEPVVFAIVITNTGNIGLGTVPVTDSFDNAYVTYSASTPAANVTNANSLIWTNLGPLSAGAGTVITAQFTAVSSGAWTNHASSAATTTNGNPVPVTTGSAPAQVVQPALTIIKTQIVPTNRPAAVGETVVFAITITNTGNVALGTVPVTDSFDNAYVSYSSALPAANVTNANSLIWTNVGPLSLGAGTVITAQFTAVSFGSWTNSAVSAPTTTNGVPVPASTGTVPAQVVAPSVVVTKTQISPTNRPAAVGETVIFALSISNSGNVAFGVVPVTDAFDTAYVSYASSLPAANITNANNVIWTNVGPLAAGAGMVVTAQFTAVSSGSWTNTAVAAPTTTNGIPVPVSTGTVPAQVVQPAVTVIKTQLSPTNGPVEVGQSVVFAIVITNTGNVALGTVPVTDSFDSVYVTYSNSAPAANVTNASSLIWTNVGPLAAGAGTVVTAQFTAVSSGSWTNRAVSAPTTTNGVPVPVSTGSVPAQVIQSGLTVIKTLVSPTNRPAAVGESVVFAIVITNTGNVGLGTVPVTDSFDNAYVTFASGMPAANITNANSVIWTNLGPLAAGAGTVVTAQFTAVSSGSWTNIARSEATTTNGNPVPVSTGSVPAQVVQPGLTVIKTQLSPTNRPAAVGETVVFAITLTNTGDVVLGTVPVTDSFNNAFVSYVSAVPVANVTNANSLIWTNLGPLAAGAGTVITAQFTAVSSGSWTNSAVSAPTTTNGVPVPVSTGSVPSQVVLPAVMVIKTQLSPTNGPVEVGQPVVFAIVITNTGNVALGSVPVTDSFNSAFVSYSNSAPAANVTNANNLIWTNVGPLAAGAGTIVTAQFTAASSGSWTNFAIAAPTTTNGVPVPVSTGSAPAQVVQSGVTVIKTQVSPTNRPAAVGETVLFAIVVTNTGNVGLGTVPVTDSFNSAFVTYSTAVPAVNLTNANSLVWTNIGPLAVGAGTVITAQFTAASSGSWTNLAVSAATTTNGNPVPISTGSAPAQVVQPALTIIKTQVSPTNRPAAVGEAVIFSIVITNTGNLSLGTVPVTDRFDSAYVSYSSSIPAANVTNANNLIWTNIGPLAAGAGTVITAQFTAVSSGLWTNSAVSAPTTTNGVPVPVSTGTVPAQVVQPALSITKTQLSPTNRPAAVGETVIFAIAITNTGNVTLGTVPLTDAFNNAYVSFAGSLPIANVTNANNVVWTNVGPLAVGAGTIVTAQFTAISSGSWTNIAVSSPSTTNGVPVPASTGTVPAQVVQAGVIITKTQLVPTNRPAAVGESVVFAITITNSGNVALGTVPVTDSFNNAFVSYSSANPPVNVTNASSIVWTNVGPLGVGGSTVVTAQFTAVSSGLWTNHAVSAPTTTNGVPVPVSTGAVPAQVVQPALTVIKTQLSPTNRPAAVGESVIFAITLTNTGNVVLGTVPVTDAFDNAYVSYASAIPPANVTNANNVIWTNLGPLSVGAGTVITAQFTAVSSGSWTNRAVSAPSTTNAVPVPVSTGVAPAQVVAPSVMITKTQVSPTNRPAAIGEAVVFAISISNSGNVALGTVPVTDAFNTAYVSYTSSVPAANVTNANNLIWTNVGPLAAGAGTVVTARFTAVSSGSWTNSAVSAPTTTNGVPVPASTGTVPARVMDPRVTVTKTQITPTNRPAAVGETVVFTISITNNGDVTLGSVPLTDTFNTNYVNFVSGLPSVNTTNASSVTWTNLGPLNVGASTIVTAQFTAVQSGSWTNTAVSTPTSTNGIPGPSSTGTVTASVFSPSVLIVKTQISPSNRPAALGEAVVFAIVVTNTGDVALGTVSVTDSFDNAYVSYSNATPAANLTNAGNVVWTNVGPLAIGAGTVVTAQFTATGSGSWTNRAVTAPTTTNGLPVPASTSTVPTLVVQPQVTVIKTQISPTNGPTAIGGPVVFAITITNSGNVVLTTVPVTDSFDSAFVSYLGSTPAANVTNANSLIWTNIGPLSVGGSTIVTAQFTAVLTGSWTNRAVSAPTTSNAVPVAPSTNMAPATNAALPHVDITNVNTSVTYDTTNLPVAGTNNTQVVGTMWWTNNLTGQTGTLAAATNWLITSVPLNVGTNTITVYGTNAFGVMTNDSVTYTRGPVGTGIPIVDITNVTTSVTYDTTNLPVAGTNNIQVVGTMWWTNALTGETGTLAAATNWLISSVSLNVGTNPITVYGTNALGVMTNDSVIYIRGPVGTGQPVLDITNLNITVAYSTTNLPVGGTNNNQVVGMMWWTNSLTGSTGSLAADTNWLIPSVSLNVGTNLITVYGTNALGVGVTDTWTVVRMSPLLLTVFSDHGSPSPAVGVWSNDVGVTITNTIQSVVTNGTTQYVSAGWVMSSNAPISGTSTVFVMTQTNDATLTWLWQTNYALTVTGLHGSVTNVVPGLKPAQSTHDLYPSNGLGYAFNHWEVNGVEAGTNVHLVLTMDEAKHVEAIFDNVFIDVTSLLDWTINWVFNPRTGTFFGSLTLSNRMDSAKGILAPVWYEVQSNEFAWFRFPTGLDTNTGYHYIDVSTQFTNQLTMAGNFDYVLDPGEYVTVTNIELMGRRTPTGIVVAIWADPPAGGVGTDAPFVDITSPNASVVYDVLTLTVNGTNNADVVGTMWWTNGLSGQYGSFTASNSWSVPNVPLAMGTNVVSVYGTNALGMQAYDSVEFIREADVPDVPVVVSNLALASRGSTITSSNGTNWAALIDGVTNGYTTKSGFGYTVWKGGKGTPGVMVLDIKAECTIESLRLFLWDTKNKFYRYKIESSQDGSSWTMIVDRSTGKNKGWQEISFAPSVQARYLRLTGTHYSGDSKFRVVEWEVFGQPPVAVVTNVTSLSKKAVSKQATTAPATSAPEYVELLPLDVITSGGSLDWTNGWRTVDGDESTGWRGVPTAGSWLNYTYDESAVSQVSVLFGEGSATNLVVLGSTNATSWTDLTDSLTNGPEVVRYLWLIFADEGDGTTTEVREVNVLAVPK